MSYTKGIWEIFETNDGRFLIRNNQGTEVCAYIKKIDDADLLVSAKDMYEALKEFIETATITDPKQIPIFNKMKRVIAKAEGK